MYPLADEDRTVMREHAYYQRSPPRVPYFYEEEWFQCLMIFLFIMTSLKFAFSLHRLWRKRRSPMLPEFVTRTT